MRKYLITMALTAWTVLNLNALDLSLADYMQLVEENSKDLYLANIDQQLADVQDKLARSATRPMISAGADYKRNFTEITMPAAVGALPDLNSQTGMYDLFYVDVPYNSKNEFSANIGVQQLLFDMKVFKALEASKQYRTMTGTIYEASRQGVLTAAKQLYYQTVLLDEVYKVKTATQQNAHDTYLDILKKFDNDLASELDVLQAEVNWQINIPEETKAGRNRDLALSNLRFLAGLKPEDEIILTDSLSKTPAAALQTELGDILSSRRDYQAMQGELALRDINISATRAEFYPSLSASIGYGWQSSSDNFEIKDGTGALQAGLSLSIPIYYGGSRFAKMEQVRLEKKKSQISLIKKQDEIRTQINNLQLLLDESAFRITSAETTLETAGKAYKIMEISSQNGLATQLDLKDARLNLSGAQLNYYSAIYDYLNSYFQWQQAIGEGDKLPY
jgi:outer membrane protein TolC